MMKIGRYELAEKLGQGGMGVVYRAFDPLLQRVVAVKLIGALEANPELRERFFREARAAGQLSHKNIITIHDLGEHDGQPFLAMEFLEGQDLQQRMAGHIPMSLARKLELAIEICEGIEYAHQHGVVHRDIKPANIFITTGGRAKILDFGLARLITSELTNSNMMMGTLNYMAPEQVRGERADHRSDIFSTGVVLYEVFGGRKAFEGDSFGATLYKILQEVPEPLPNIDANLPPALVGIVERALEKSRDERYQHMSEMLRDLTAYRQQQMLIDSPAFGRAITGAAGTLSGPDAPAIAASPARPLSPVPAGSGSSPDAETVLRAIPAAAPWRRLALPGVAAVIVLAAFGAWMMTRGSAPPPPTAETRADAPGLATDQAIASRLEQASRALQSGDPAAAQRHAEAVLAINPGHVEARRLRDRARQTAESVARSLSNARASFGSGRFDDASRAAGEVLAVDPDNADAKRLMEDAAARTRGKGADEARARMARAKNSAVSAGAPTLSPASYAAAISAERAASSLHEQGRLAEAMAKFWEANGLFRSAEGAAQTEAAVRSERARVARAAPKVIDPATPEAFPPKAAPQAPLPPAVPSPVSGGLPLSPVQPPAAPPQAPTAQALPAETAPPRVPTNGINEILDRYKAALESRSLGSLKRLWPSLGGAQESAIRQEFENASRIDVEIVNPQITVNGTSATVTFIRRYQLQTVDRQRPRTDTRTTMSLHRSGTTWVIDQMRFEQVR